MPSQPISFNIAWYKVAAREASHTVRVCASSIPGYAVIQATSAETGDNEAQIGASVDGEPIEIAFNVKYMTDVLNVIDTPQVALETSNPTEQGAIKPVDDNGFVHIIMPMHFGR